MYGSNKAAHFHCLQKIIRTTLPYATVMLLQQLGNVCFSKLWFILWLLHSMSVNSSFLFLLHLLGLLLPRWFCSPAYQEVQLEMQRSCPSVSFTVQQTLNKLCTTKHFSSTLLYWPCPHFERSKEKLNKGVCGWTARTTTKDTQLSLTWNCQHRATCSLVIWTRTHAHWVEYMHPLNCKNPWDIL